MSPDDDGEPISDSSNDAKQPEASQQEAGGFSGRKSALDSAKARREEILQRRRQNIDKLDARINARSQGQNPLPHELLRASIVPNPANLSSNPAAEARDSEPAATTENQIGKMGGQGNISNQAGTIINLNVSETVAKEFMQGKFEGFFKASTSLGTLNEGEEASSGIGLPKAQNSFEEKFIKGVQSSSTGAAFVNKPRARAKTSSKALPKGEKEIERWYYQELNSRERCFVQAAAVLHGAPLRAISEATRELYTPLKEKDEARKAQAKPQPSAPPPAPTHQVPDAPPSSVSDFLVRIYSLIQQEERVRVAQSSPTEEISPTPAAVEASEDSISTLLERTHTYTRRVNGATRLFWQDADESGLSRFSIDLLRFLAREEALDDMFGPQPDQSFLDIIGEWPARYQGERSWRSASALGVIWWHQDARNLLWRQANKWAKSQREQDWERAAALLDGAYQVECDSARPEAENSVNSSVLQLLEQWISVAHQAKTERGEGYAAARAYALIGRKSPEVALKGLQHLLCFPQQATDESPYYPPEDLFVFGILKYVDLIRSGHIRQVLKHLADEAERYAHWQGVPQLKGESKEGPNQRSVALYVIFTAFFLVTSCSLSAVEDMAPATYSASEPLSAHPSCPDGEGRDILLAGLLTKAEQPLWRDQLATLLCALIMDKNYQSAFYLLRRWGEIVLQDKSANAPVLEKTYVQFLVEVGKQVQNWSAHRSSKQLFAFRTYRYGLTLWLTDRRVPQPAFSQLAQKVLDQFPETS